MLTILIRHKQTTYTGEVQPFVALRYVIFHQGLHEVLLLYVMQLNMFSNIIGSMNFIDLSIKTYGTASKSMTPKTTLARVNNSAYVSSS